MLPFIHLVLVHCHLTSQLLSYSRNFWKQQIETRVWELHIIQLTSASMLTTTEPLLISNKKIITCWWFFWEAEAISRLIGTINSEQSSVNTGIYSCRFIKVHSPAQLFLSLTHYLINLYISLYFLKQHLMWFESGKQTVHDFEKLVAQHFENGTGRNSDPFKGLLICQ